MALTSSPRYAETRGPWIAFIAVFGILSILAFWQTVPGEDAVILYEYARNLAEKGVISYGGSLTPIEGATDFLWMVIIAAFSALGVSEFGAALLLNLLAILLLVHQIKSNAARLALGIALLGTPYLYASLNGFSAVLFGALYVLCMGLALRRSRLLYVSVLLLCLIRPDGAVWGVGLVAYRLMTECTKANWKSEGRLLLLGLVAPGILYFAWRAWYFSEFLPLPFLVKASGNRDLLIFFKDSVWSIAPVAAPIVLAVAVGGKGARKSFELLLFFIAPILFYASMRLEQNIGNRFMAPLFFGAFYWIYARLNIRALYVFLIASIYLQYGTTVATVLSVANSKNENVFYISQELSQTDGRMLTTEAGRLAYYSNWFTEDSWGLNTPRFAHHLVDERAMAEGRYDMVVAHCDLLLLNPDAEHQHDNSRAWTNQCKEITAFIKRANYKIFLVPFVRSNLSFTKRVRYMLAGKAAPSTDSCNRYDIYAISPNYKDAALVERILREHRAVEYAASIVRPGWDIACP